MTVQTSNIPVNEVYTAIAIQYENKQLIADEVLPRIPVQAENFTHLVYNEKDGLSVPNTLVGRKSATNKMTSDGKEVPNCTEDHGVEDGIPQKDIDNAKAPYDPVSSRTKSLTNTIKLSREVRTANLVFDPKSYASDNTLKLGADDKFDVYEEKSDPLGLMLEAIETPIMRPTCMIIGSYAWSKLRRHPKIVKAIHGNSGDVGAVRTNEVAELLELDKVLVGRGLINISKKKSGIKLYNAWDNCVSFIYQNEFANTNEGATFGYSAEYETIQVKEWEDPNIGVKGGKVIRVYEQIKEIIAAPALGFLLQDVVTPKA